MIVLMHEIRENVSSTSNIVASSMNDAAHRRGFVPETIETYYYEKKTRRLLYYIFGSIIKGIFPLMYRFKVEGKNNIPKSNHCIFMPNHISHFDSFAVGYPLWPKPPAHYIADEKLFKNRFFAWVAKRINVFPIRKGAKQLDVVQYAIDLVNSGSTLLWYPEGQRHKNPRENKLNKGKLGSGLIAHQTKVPIIPVFLHGSEFAMPVGKAPTWGRCPRSITITVKYGEPVYLDDLRALPSSKEVSKLVVDRILDAIEDLRPEGSYVMF